MNEAPAEQRPEKPTETPGGYERLLLESAVVVSLAVLAFMTIRMGTWGFFGIAFSMALLGSICPMVVMLLVVTAIYNITRGILSRRGVAAANRRKWLRCPPYGIAAILVLASVWSSLPGQHLSRVCSPAPQNARHVRVAGVSGFLAGSWMAVFEVSPNIFRDWAREKALQPAPGLTMSNLLQNAIFLKKARLTLSLPTSTSADGYQKVHLDSTGRERGGLFALYDPGTSNAIVIRSYHD